MESPEGPKAGAVVVPVSLQEEKQHDPPLERNEDVIKNVTIAKDDVIKKVAVDNSVNAKTFLIAVVITIGVIVVALVVAVTVAAITTTSPTTTTTTTTTTRVRFTPQFELELQVAVKQCLHESPVGDKCPESNGPIGSWDVSLVTQMPGMFKDAKLYNTGISSWNVAEVTNMSSMFEGAKAFNQDIGKWDVSKVSLTHTTSPTYPYSYTLL